MQLILALEHRFHQTPDGAVWTTSAYGRPYWTRYLEVFDEVRVVARAHRASSVPENSTRVDGDGVSFVSLPGYVGPVDYLRNWRAVKDALSSCVPPGQPAIVRGPGVIASTIAAGLRKRDVPYGLEVVGDPHDVFARGVVDHPLRPLMRSYFTRSLRRDAASAAAVSYVTRAALQRRYPTNGLSFAVSDVELPNEAYLSRGQRAKTRGVPFSVMLIGSLAQLYKGPDVAIRALRLCREKGLDVSLEIVGEGKYRPTMELLAREQGVGPFVTFRGQVPSGRPVRELLDKADLFIIPSRTEGMPRALLEAMARSLPCVGSNVGGIPEILSPECLIQPGDHSGLAAMIEMFAMDAHLCDAHAMRNYRLAETFRDRALAEARKGFLVAVREASEAAGRS